jgi:hypothetical protein
LQQSLQQILGGAHVCLPLVAPQQLANQVCAMVYTYPYAILTLEGNSEYRLGEKNDSCDVPPDLCGSSSSLLRSWVADFLSQLPTLTCQ